MRHGTMISRAFVSMIVFVAAIFFSFAVFLVFKTYQRSIETDIFYYTRELEDRIIRLTGTEYRRYMLLTDIGKTIDGKEAEKKLRNLIEGKSDIFDLNGEFQKLVSAIGYYDSDSPQTAYEYEIKSGEWKTLSDVFGGRPEAPGWNLVLKKDRNDKTDIFMIEVIGNGGRTLFFRLDSSGFFDGYVKDIINDIDPDLRFEWFEGNNFGTEKYRNRAINYKFRPFNIIFSYKKNITPLIVEMPGLWDFQSNIIKRPRRDSIPPEPGSKQRKAPEMDQKNDPGNNINNEPPPFFHSGFYVKVYHQNGSYYYNIERKAAISFLETVFIFIIIAALFIIILIQLQRSRIMRYKEQQFVASVTHELRTPLTVIRSAADNLSSGIVPSEKLKLYSSLITEQSDRLSKMIEEILLYSSLEGKHQQKSIPEEISLSLICEELKKNFNQLTSSSMIEIKWDIIGLPDKVISSPEAINMVLSNLITNALNHAYIGIINDNDKKQEIRVSFKMLIPNMLHITVEDDGRGIENRELKHIFSPFYRDAISRSRQEKGSGLGLFIAKQKAHISGGKLIVKSPYKRDDGSMSNGCKFILTLPCSLKSEET
ncbi:MAG: HAMP domain-containing sensor histidine kinase [Spirochaetales bacterium]|nr:HAMP domain-containing sensor histidine kinase [Spirochaetales bacterium]